jgi:nicotinamidase-related amidase
MEEKKALLIMDVQNGTVKMLPDNESLISAVSKALIKARKNNIPVIYVVIGFRKGYPEVSRNNKSFSAIKGSNRNFDSEEAFRVYDSVAPKEGDITVIKKRISAFAGSDLEIILRSMEIKRIVLAGIATSGVVLSTLREAADKDYAITVLSDACADGDAEVHRVLMTKIFARQADVMTTDEWNG